MSTEAMKRIKSLLQDCAKIDSHTISAVVAECDMAILAQHPATGEPVKAAPYNPTEEMRWAMKRIDPALSSDQCRALWSAAWSASPSTHPSPSVPDDVARDAERYRWLREQNESLESFTFYVGCDNGPDDDGSVEWVGADLDAAIDAAMLAAKEKP